MAIECCFTCNSVGFQVYSGYVDDPRNTDNAWLETVAYNFHDETGEYVGQLRLHAGKHLIVCCRALIVAFC